MIDRAHPHTTAVDAVPLPPHDRRTYLDGPLPERLGRLIDRLLQEYAPARGRPLLLLATTDATLKAICAELRVPFCRSTAPERPPRSTRGDHTPSW